MNHSEVTRIFTTNSHPFWLAIQVGLWSCLTVLSVTGNIVVLMCVVLGAKRLCSSMYVFYASLATSDCLVGKFVNFGKNTVLVNTQLKVFETFQYKHRLYTCPECVENIPRWVSH